MNSVSPNVLDNLLDNFYFETLSMMFFTMFISICIDITEFCFCTRQLMTCTNQIEFYNLYLLKSLHVNAFTYYRGICFLWFHSMLFFSSNSGLTLLIYRETCFYSFMLWIFNAQCLHICEIFLCTGHWHSWYVIMLFEW